MLFANVISAAAVALGFGGYLFGFTGAPVLVVSLGLVAVCTLLLVWGVKETVWVGVAFTAAEVLGLLIVIFVAARFIGGVDYLEAPSGVQGLLQATLLIFFAYLGFDQIANLSEETRNPGKVVPAAILIAIGVTTVLYVAVAVSSVSVLGWQALSESGAPLADVVEAATGARASVVISVIALFATANTVLFLLLTASRMAYGMGSTGAFPRVIARIHPSRKTPWVATLAVSGIAGVVVLVQDITAIAEVTNVAVLAAFVGVNASLIRLRRKAPDAARGFRVPLSVLGVPAPTALAIVLSVIMIANTGLNALLIGVVLVAVGIAIPLLTPAPRSEAGESTGTMDARR
jgi:APA family basic amino acid/polyamine antiporter